MGRDFTFQKYRELCEAISDSGYHILTMKEYLTSEKLPEKFIIIRHDVDSEPEYSLKMAGLEKELDISSTYYFRHIEGIFLPEMMSEISDMGHEIGYHYEVVDKALGDHELAIEIFSKELSDFRKVCDVRTIAQHGSPVLGGISATSFSGAFHILKAVLRNEDIFTRWVNADLWKEYDLRDFGLLGEAYLSLDFNKIYYLSDSGRNWDPSRNKFRDTVDVNTSLNIKKTDDIIELIRSEEPDALCLLVHANQWKEHFGEWLNWLFFQYVRNTGKTLLKYKRRR